MSINLYEKDIEKMLVDERIQLRDMLRECFPCGKGGYRSNFKVTSQNNFGDFGRTDILIRTDFNNKRKTKKEITIVELKTTKGNCESLMQLCRYISALKYWIPEAKNITIRGILLTNGFDLESDFIYLLGLLRNIKLVGYTFGINGFDWDAIHAEHYSMKGFKYGDLSLDDIFKKETTLF